MSERSRAPLRRRARAGTMWEMKVSLLRCVCLALIGTQLAGCGDQADSVELDPTPIAERKVSHPTPSELDGTTDEESAGDGEDNEQDGAEAAEPATPSDCPDVEDPPSGCGQISIKLKGLGSSCRLMPTASDLTRSPRSVRFDCTRIERGPNGYDYDALGHITLMGETCQALQTGGPHRVTLSLGCGPDTSEL
jgi:hypothetical protein